MTRLTCTIAMGVATSIASAGAIIYVDDDAAPGGDGASWDDAYRHLHLALAAAQPGVEIRVAQGHYVPDPQEADRLATFALANDVALRGGFAGLGAPDPDERDPDLYETILSGDLAANDGPDFENYEDNSFHVVTGSGTNASALLEGFTITAGNANGPVFPETESIGAGLLVVTGSPTVRDCRFTANLAREAGAGLCNLFSSSPDVSDCVFEGNRVPTASISIGAGVLCFSQSNGTFTDCVFRGNRADLGAGLAAQECSTRFEDCVFEQNGSMQGGGFISLDAPLEFINCAFLDNFASVVGGGGAIGQANPNAGAPCFFGCVFDDNESFHGGGLVIEAARVTVVNSTFARNQADEKAGGTGGAVLNLVERPLFRNTIFWGNIPNEVVDDDGGGSSLKFCCIQGGWDGSGSSNTEDDPLLVGINEGNLRLSAGSPVIDAGDTSSAAGVATTDLDGNPRFDDDPCTENTGRASGSLFMIDLGAYEYQVPCPADLDCSGVVDLADVLELLVEWGSCGGCVEDLDGDRRVDFADVIEVLTAWGPC